jgi:hypothetical protein
MSVLERISSSLGVRNAKPDQELARDLAASKDRKGIQEIAENLRNEDQRVASDCIKVLYEIGYIDPALIRKYVGDFLELLRSKSNRMVWGAMIALATIAELEPDRIFGERRAIQKTIEGGTVITEVWGLKTLTRLAAKKGEYYDALWKFLLGYVREGRAVDLPTRIEDYEMLLNGKNAKELVKALGENKNLFKKSQRSRINRVLARHGALFE